MREERRHRERYKAPSAGLSLCALVLVCGLFPSPAAAQEGAAEPPRPATRVVEGLRKTAHEALTRAQAQLEAGESGAALDTINRLLADADTLNSFELASAYQTRAFVHADRDDYRAAATDLERVIDTGGFRAAALLDVRFNLAQLYLGMEAYEQALELLQDWFAAVENPQPRAYFLLALAHYQLGQLAEAKPYAEHAVVHSGAPREPWYQLLLRLHIEDRSYGDAARLLETMIATWPAKKSYFTQLAGVYYELGRERDAFAVQQLAYEQGFLTASPELVRLAQLYAYYGAPYRAARLLEDEMAAGRVETTRQTLELLANAWFRARDWARAIPPLRQAAAGADSGMLSLRLGQALFEDERWSDAESALAQALEKGGLADEGTAWLMLGMARANQAAWQGAMAAFEQAARFDTAREAANRWLLHSQRERAEAAGIEDAPG